MKSSVQQNVQVLELNGQPLLRNYSAEVSNTIAIGKNNIHSCTAVLFSLRYLGSNANGNLEFRVVVDKRLFLDEKHRPIFKPSKAQKIALMVAKINDDLTFEVNKEYKLLGISNTDTVRLRWKSIRIELLQMYPDFEELCSDFDWQLREENIQTLFKTDNFYNFFFANIFYQRFENDELPEVKKQIANGLENLNIPITEKRNISEQDMLFQNIAISTSGELDTSNKKFPKDKINLALGRMLGENGTKHTLEFNYDGLYQVKPRIGLITRGKLNYEFTIPEIYQKKTTINFKLEEDE